VSVEDVFRMNPMDLLGHEDGGEGGIVIDFEFRQEIHRILAAAIDLGMAFLPAKPFYRRHRHTADTDGRERIPDFLQLERLDYRADQFHSKVLPSLARTVGALAQRSAARQASTGFMASSPRLLLGSRQESIFRAREPQVLT